MVPRADIVAVDADGPLADVIELMTASGHSRLPVYRETLDDAVGMVHIKDVLAWRGRDEQFQLSKLLRRVLFVAPSMEVLQLLLEMRASRTHMALVVDEFGGVDGLITIEDLVEEIVGEIRDEHEASSDIVRESDTSYIVPGSLDVDRLDELFHVRPEARDASTVAGLVSEVLGHIPQRGEVIEADGLRYEVLDSTARHVKRLRISVKQPTKARA